MRAIRTCFWKSFVNKSRHQVLQVAKTVIISLIASYTEYILQGKITFKHWHDDMFPTSTLYYPSGCSQWVNCWVNDYFPLAIEIDFSMYNVAVRGLR